MSFRSGVLVIDDLVPDPSRDAGSVMLLSHLRSLRRLGHEVHFLALYGRYDGLDQNILRLEREGCVVMDNRVLSLNDAVHFACQKLSFIYVQRYNNVENVLSCMLHADCRVIYGLIDLHHLRMMRQAQVMNDSAMAAEAEWVKQAEYNLMARCCQTVTPSFYEERLVKANRPDINITSIAWDVMVGEPRRSGGMKAIGFIGGFAHSPNVDAATFLVRELMPAVWNSLPECVCVLAGSNTPQAVWSLASERVRVLGYVERLQDFFDQVGVTVAPLRFGAGLKGKVLDSLASGVPCVMSATALEGLDLPRDLLNFVSDDATSMAKLITSLLVDQLLYADISNAGVHFVAQRFSRDGIDACMERVFGRARDSKQSHHVAGAVVTPGVCERETLVVVDVGAAGGIDGQWDLLPFDITGVLFEPNPIEANRIRQNASQLSRTIVIEKALGDMPETRELYKTQSLGCWSLRRPNQKFLKEYSISPAFIVRDVGQVETTTYLELFESQQVPSPDVIKIDVQGFEMNVLKGFGDLLRICVGVKLEVHLYPLYQDEALLGDYVQYLANFGLFLRKLEPTGKFDGDIVEMDAWFTTSDCIARKRGDRCFAKLRGVEHVWGLGSRKIDFNHDIWQHEW